MKLNPDWLTTHNLEHAKVEEQVLVSEERYFRSRLRVTRRQKMILHFDSDGNGST